MFTRSLWILVLLLCSVSFALAAEPSVIEGAKKEAALVFYTTMDIQNSKPLLDAFTKKYPFIRSDLVRLGGTAMVSRIITEAQAGASKFDVAPGHFAFAHADARAQFNRAVCNVGSCESLR